MGNLKKLKLQRFCLFVEIIFALLPVVVYIVLFKDMPDSVPVHFSANGVPNRFAGKLSFEMIFISIVGFIGLAIGMLISKLIKASKKDKKVRQPQIVEFVAMNGCTIFLLSLFDMISIYALVSITYNITIDYLLLFRFLFASLFLWLFLIGVSLPKTIPNKLFGIRTSKTLCDKEVWIRVHKQCGFILRILGILGLCTTSIGLIPQNISLLLSGLILFLIFLCCSIILVK